MDPAFPSFTFGRDQAITPGSQLDTLARLNPGACNQYAQVLLKDLDRAMVKCPLGEPSTSLAERFEQIHALKNVVIPTGSTSLLAACATLQTYATRAVRPEDLQGGFNAIAQATRRLIVAYQASVSSIK
ncbi:MAG: hypothetical protein ACREPQ_00780 [Rhodanobacter sp.]